MPPEKKNPPTADAVPPFLRKRAPFCHFVTLPLTGEFPFREGNSFSSLYCLKKQLVIARAAMAQTRPPLSRSPLPFREGKGKVVPTERFKTFVGCDKRKQKHARIRKSESAIRAITLPSALLRFYFSSTSIKPLRRRVSPRLLYNRSGVSQLSLLEG